MFSGVATLWRLNAQRNFNSDLEDVNPHTIISGLPSRRRSAFRVGPTRRTTSECREGIFWAKAYTYP